MAGGFQYTVYSPCKIIVNYNYFKLLFFYFRRLWTPTYKCLHNAVVSDPLCHLPAQPYSSEDLGLSILWRLWNYTESSFGHLGKVRRVSGHFYLIFLFSMSNVCKFCGSEEHVLNLKHDSVFWENDSALKKLCRLSLWLPQKHASDIMSEWAW